MLVDSDAHEEVDNVIEVEFSGKGSPNYGDVYTEIMLDVFSIEHGFASAMENFTQALLNRGIQVNPDTVYAHIDQVHVRMIRLMITKRLCWAMGLAGEMDQILQHEMSMIYRPASYRGVPGPKPEGDTK
jgi:hypothetical protein